MQTVKHLLFLCAIALTFFAAPAQAATLPLPATSSEQSAQSLPEPLTKASASSFLASLSDKEVRALLNKQLQGIAEQQQQAQEAVGLRTSLREGIANTRDSIITKFAGMGAMAGIFEGIAAQFSLEQFGDSFIPKLMTTLAGVIIIAFAVEWLVFAVVYRLLKVQQSTQKRCFSISEKLWMLSKIFALRVASLALFYAIAEELMSWFSSYEVERSITLMVLDYIFVARTGYLIGAFFMSPRYTNLRLFNLTDQQAKTFLRRQIIVCIFGASGIFTNWVWELGVDVDGYRIGFFFNVLFYLSLIWVVWSSREIITDMLLHTKAEITESRRKFALAWPKITVGAIVLVWLVFQAIIANAAFEDDFIWGATFTLLTVVSVPFFDVAILALIEHYYPIDELADKRMLSIRRSLQGSLIRITRLLLMGIILLLYPVLWGFSYHDLASQGLGAKATSAVLEVATILLISYILWEVINALVKRQLMLEAPEDEEEADEGGQGLSRTATVLPILHVTATAFIVIFTLFAVLTAIGFNTTPLLAGAGVFGLAVGFGAQTLVKDIVSGIFFLIDDALRMGEYVDTGEIKGTVEKIALRSLRLRHHLGALHTIPYGDISRLTNYSRDWVIMKLPLRVTYDTDINRIKKLFKKLGKSLLEHPELGEDFLQPFKSQGVLEVDEVGMVIRGKFTCKPGRQFMIRKEIYLQVQRIFAENGIEFAKRKVEVQIPDSVPAQVRHQVSAAASEALNQQVDPSEQKPA
ncbi:MAG: mechanosensitive ion channel family protein [Pseudomonadales bacterium]